jgi:hypothetical protein
MSDELFGPQPTPEEIAARTEVLSRVIMTSRGTVVIVPHRAAPRRPEQEQPPARRRRRSKTGQAPE